MTVRPIVDLTGDAHFSEVFFDDVALDADALVGREGDGWTQVNAELAFERSGPEHLLQPGAAGALAAGAAPRRRRRAADRGPGPSGGALATLRRMSIAVTARLAAGESPLVESALFRDLGTELEQTIPVVIEEAAAADPDGEPDADLLRTAAYLAQVAPTFVARRHRARSCAA